LRKRILGVRIDQCRETNPPRGSVAPAITGHTAQTRYTAPRITLGSGNPSRLSTRFASGLPTR
jgi:hypothetical protein